MTTVDTYDDGAVDDDYDVVPDDDADYVECQLECDDDRSDCLDDCANSACDVTCDDDERECLSDCE